MTNSTKTWKWGLQKVGIRYQNRQPPLWMRMNMHNGKCWCGKSFKWPRRKYCCDTHANLWFYSIRAYWEGFRLQVIRRDNFTCQECGLNSKCPKCVTNSCEHDKDDTKFDVDHIQAISLGGMCYDLENVRTMCRGCHHKKTSQDMKHLKRERRKLQSLEIYN